MAYISMKHEFPGIGGLLFYKPSTGYGASALAQAALRGPSSLTEAEREIIATYVSKLNECEYCHESHKAVVNEYLKDDNHTITCMLADMDTAPLSDKMKALLRIAAKVQKNGKLVSAEDVAYARSHGAVDEDIYDTVVVAAAFCFFNRIVDGLNTALPGEGDNDYEDSAKRLVSRGYKFPKNPLIIKFILWMRDRKQRKIKAAQDAGKAA
jgi:uncharacterized peroxidase-related enzyme